MTPFPLEFIRFLEREAPLFIHTAAVLEGMTPFTCRGYGARLEAAERLLWVMVRGAQWERLAPCLEEETTLAVLLTAGVDNESYQAKRPFVMHHSPTESDVALLERQRQLAARQFPGLAGLTAVRASDCVAIGIRVNEIYRQKLGDGAGMLLVSLRNGGHEEGGQPTC